MSDIFVGIDPGLSGYIAVLGQDARPRFWPAPVILSGSGRNVYDLVRLNTLTATWRNDGARLVVIEQQQAFPKQGGVSNFTIGYGYGAWKSALTAAGLAFEEVRPARWKKALGLVAGEQAQRKRQAVEKAQSLFPGVDLRALEVKPRARVLSPDKAEALLLAVYAQRSVAPSAAPGLVATLDPCRQCGETVVVQAADGSGLCPACALARAGE